MKIIPTNLYSYKTNSNQYIKQSSIGSYTRPTLRYLQGDIICFKGIEQDAPEDIQLYRCIGESEFQKLITGELISSSGYATSSPMGWQAKYWDSAFGARKKDSSYFITFKKCFKDIMDRRDSEKDTRFSIEEKYSLKNIENIRKGINAHGEIVWAENFEKTKKEDVEVKEREINKLVGMCRQGIPSSKRKEIIAELVSYTREFPNIVELYEPLVDYNKAEDVNNLAYLISEANDGKYLPIYRKCLDCYANGIEPNNKSYAFLVKQGKREAGDLDRIFNLIQNQKYNYTSDLCNALVNLTDEDEIETIVQKLNNNTPSYMNILSEYLLKKDSKGKFLKTVETLFAKTCNPSKEIEDSFDDFLENSCANTNCMRYLENFGNANTIIFLEKLCKEPWIKESIILDIRYSTRKIATKVL